MIDKLCLFVEELSNPSSPHLVVLDLHTGKDLSTTYRQELMKFGTVYPFQIYKTKLVLRGGAEFYIPDLKQGKLTHSEGTFVVFIGDKLLYLGKTDSKAKNQVPMLFCLELDVQILHHELDGSGRLILVCQGYIDQTFMVFDVTSLKKLLDHKLFEDLSVHQVLASDHDVKRYM